MLTAGLCRAGASRVVEQYLLLGTGTVQTGFLADFLLRTKERGFTVLASWKHPLASGLASTRIRRKSVLARANLKTTMIYLQTYETDELEGFEARGRLQDGLWADD